MKENINGVDRYRMYIGGQWVDSSSKETIEVLNPTNEEVIATVPDASVEDGRRALEAARDAQPAWAALPAVNAANTSCDSPRNCGNTASDWPGC
jgi:lactaldehyde dehydrogenase/glycolaldehyde dehydrogenase